VFSGLPVSEAMITEFRALDERASLADAVEALLSGSQPDFPVVSDGRVVGVLPRTELLKALASNPRETPISRVMRTDCRTVTESDSLEDALDRVRESGCPLVPVLRSGRLVGLLTQDNLAELMMVRRAMRGKPTAAA
jgi:predicted transcriptional regulator